MLKGEDEAAVRLLENDTEKLPYYEVTRRFLLGVCYYRIGKEEQGKRMYGICNWAWKYVEVQRRSGKICNSVNVDVLLK